MAPDPKPAPRIVATRNQWRALRRDLLRGSYGKCVGCRIWFPVALLNLHHVRPRSLRGDDLAQNLVPLCGSGTTGCHGTYENRSPGWLKVAARIREHVTARPLMLAYALDHEGGAWFDRYYPTREETDDAP